MSWKQKKLNFFWSATLLLLLIIPSVVFVTSKAELNGECNNFIDDDQDGLIDDSDPGCDVE